MMKRILAMLLCVSMLLAFAACSKDDKENKPDASTPPSEEKPSSAYSTALDVMKAVWDNLPEESKFPCYGGNMTEEPVTDAPAQFDLSDKDGLSYMLLIPEDVQKNVDDAASLMHLMNANTFTGAVLHLSGAEVTDVAAKLETAILGNQFLCGFPEKLVLISTGDYLIYAFGAGDLISAFQSAALENVTGATLVKEAAFE